ncbi:uncharacterized protein LOC112508487 isoform X1 [Cynara cardunculus var. scolymus]|uniref:uncharacterized protein LOC112508462 isoform X1 n=1 Tax=Cynara cardunculus var. scolymus TaxID=59895 RepID=UPI000D624B51|nr:uncharacterized protein LOC112508462 isoform X1 [Cynara cardunculus var. scolymus]XP_024968881.1 uncharacterized protein LOC112508487 isoform X1 [Cynara cardunculus var. scolymus]
MSAKMAALTTTLHNLPSTVAPNPNRSIFSIHRISSSSGVWNKASFRIQRASNVFSLAGSKRMKTHEPSFSKSRRGYLMCAINDNKSEANSKATDQKVSDSNVVEPFGGKSGSVSFIGLTHQLVEEGKLVSTPFKESRSLLWIVAPIAIILSVLIPQFFGIISDELIKDVVLTEIVYTATSEVMFYIGLATFLLVTDRVQRPYLQYSTKRWSLITGLRGYLTSAFLVMGFKVLAPLFAAFVTWPLIGLAGVVSVSPYLMGCLVQFIYEKICEKRGSSCWPLVPIVFEVYRLYQLSKAMHFMEKLMFQMRGLPKSPELMEKSGALAAMIVTFEVLAVVCIWSFLTFIQRLFPSRPIAENY